MGPEVTTGSASIGVGGHPPAPVLAFSNLSKQFGGEKALNQVDFSVLPGEVHGLLGQNGSGKSTLIKILAGLHAPDPGAQLQMHGHEVRLPLTPGQFRELGISFVHQNLALEGTLTVFENLFVDPRQGRWRISEQRDIQQAQVLFDRFEVDIDPIYRVEQLSPVQRAQLAIVRALNELATHRPEGLRGGLLILDEPTPFLPRHDVDKLFNLVRGVVAQGASVIFVSHDVDEVLEITDRATVLRDGRVAAQLITRQASKEAFVEAIVGRKFQASSVREQASLVQQRPILAQVDQLVGERCLDFSLTLHQGEVVGLTGLVGSGYSEVLHLLYGSARASSGRLTMVGQSQELSRMTPQRALERGVVLVPADRPVAGGVLDLSVLDNLTLPLLGAAWRGWRIPWASLQQQATGLIAQFQVKPGRADLDLGALSGGNQQKVILAKWFQTRPQLILLDEPTQGVDIGARQEVFAAIQQAARQGAAVLCASTDYEQLSMLCSRVLIFASGRVRGELVGDEVTKDAIAERCYHSLDPQDSPRGALT
jgi:ribose transport system ATP-binding protein